MTIEKHKEEINIYFDNFLLKSKKQIDELLTQGDLSGEDKASVISSIMSKCIEASLRASFLRKQIDTEEEKRAFLNKQIDTEGEKKALVEAEKKMKIEQKYSIIAQRKRQQGVEVDEDGNFNYSKEGNSLIEKQIQKVAADKDFVITQKIEMQRQVNQNVIIKGMDAMSDYVMGIGQAGLKPSQAMHTNFFAGHKILLLEAGAKIGDDGLITYKIGDTTYKIAKFDVEASANK